MRRPNKLLVALATGVVILPVIAAAIVFLLPVLIDAESIARSILVELNRSAGCEAEFEGVQLSFFPRPRVVVHHIKVNFPKKVSATVESLTAFPQLLPLLAAQVQLSGLVFDTPTITVFLPQGSDREEEGFDLFLHKLEEQAAGVIARSASIASGLAVRIEHANIDLSYGNEPVFRFWDVGAHIAFPPSDFKVEVTGKSNLWDDFSLNARLNPPDFKGEGLLVLKHFRPSILSSFFFASSRLLMEDSPADIEISLGLDSPKALRAEIKASIPTLSFDGDGRKFSMKGGSIEGALHLTGEKLSIDLSRLQFTHPRAGLTGTFLLDRTAAPVASYDLEGTDLDADSVREGALFLFGESRVIQKVFDIVRGGRVPLLTFSNRADSFALLGKADNLVIKGNMVEGKIFVPKAELEVEGVRGEVIISEGVLDARGLNGRIGSSTCRDGVLTVGLKPGDGPFHLDMDLDVTLAQLLPVLERVVKSEPFLRELSLIEDIDGRAAGRLVLGESLRDVKTKVDLRDFQLASHYQRIPYPVELKGGTFRYESESKIEAGPLRGVIGKSSFSGLFVLLDWGKHPGASRGFGLPGGSSTGSSYAGPYIELTSGAGTVSVDEIHAWLKSYEKIGNTLKSFDSMKGGLTVETLKLKGPLLRPGLWDLKVNGSVERLGVRSTRLPGEAELAGGKFEASRDTLSVTDCRMSLLDASLTLSARLDNYLTGLSGGEMTIGGSLGPQSNQWTSDAIQLPVDYRLRAPVSVAGAHVNWTRGGKTHFAGKMEVRDGPAFQIDLLQGPGELTIDNLAVKDGNSNATLSLNLRKEAFDLRFSGTLSKSSLDGLLQRNRLLKGWVKGDLQAHILTDSPMSSTARGELDMMGFEYAQKQKAPVIIEKASLSAEGNRVTIKSALVDWQDIHMNLKGNVDFSPRGFMLDMDLLADGFDWEKIRRIIDGESPGGLNPGPADVGRKQPGADDSQRSERPQTGAKAKAEAVTLPRADPGETEVPQDDLPLRHPDGTWSYRGATLQGVVRVHAGYFTYGKMTWKPLAAAVFFRPDGVVIDITEAALCGVSTPGILKLSSRSISLDLKPKALQQDADFTLDCLWHEKGLIKGAFDLKGEMKGEGKMEDLARSLRGNLEFTTRNGRIYRLSVLSKIFALLNLTEIYRGRLPDLTNEGFAYDWIEARGSLKNGKIILEESIIDAPSMKMVWKGDMDFVNKNMDFTVLVAPLRTVDKIIGHIPLVGEILGGALISIPVEVKGDISDPTVIPLSPSAVGSELLGYMRRTLGLPFKVIQPLF